MFYRHWKGIIQFYRNLFCRAQKQAFIFLNLTTCVERAFKNVSDVKPYSA